MTAGRVIGYVAAGILIFFGVLFLWGAGGEGGGGWRWVFIGLVSVLLGFGLIYLSGRRRAASAEEGEVSLELPAEVELERLTCRSCGAALSAEHVRLVAGAVLVTCPYCGATYQWTEAPKW